MKTIKKPQCQCHHCNHAGKCSGSHCEDRVHLLINAASAARAGTARLTLNDWHEVEVKENLPNEYT